MPGNVISVRTIAASQAREEPVLRATWDRFLEQNRGATLFYQSPEYFEHIAKLRADSAILAVVEGGDGAPIGVVPIRRSTVSLRFEARDYRLADVRFEGLRILGGTLLAPPSPEVFETLLKQVALAYPDCKAIEIAGLSTASPLWRYLRDDPAFDGEFTVYVPNGPRRCHTTIVPDSFADYLQGFGRKKRYNLKRQIRLLREHGNGLTLTRISAPADVETFQAARVALGLDPRHLGTREVREIEVLDLAERGLLHSYVLATRDRPCALVFATRFRDTLVIHHFRHDASIAHLSPGTVIQTLMMKDLAESRLVRRIDYGFGEPKYRLNNDVDERVSVVILRRGMVSQSVVRAHRAFVWLTDGVKRMAGASIGVAAPVNAGAIVPVFTPF